MFGLAFLLVRLLPILIDNSARWVERVSRVQAKVFLSQMYNHLNCNQSQIVRYFNRRNTSCFTESTLLISLQFCLFFSFFFLCNVCLLYLARTHEPCPMKRCRNAYVHYTSTHIDFPKGVKLCQSHALCIFWDLSVDVANECLCCWSSQYNNNTSAIQIVFLVHKS